MSTRRFDSAEAFFHEAWERDQLDRDFSGNPTAKNLYQEEAPSEVPHFKYPVKTEKGEAYVYQSIPTRLFAERYRQQLEAANISARQRLGNAMDAAENHDHHDDVRILAETRDRLQQANQL